MKTTVEISDSLLRAAKAEALARGVTLRALIEEGLERIVDPSSSTPSFALRNQSVGGNGARGWHDLTDDERVEAMYET
jgi:hypothetical protein